MSNNSQLHPEFIVALMNWQSQGARTVKIELSRFFATEENRVLVWVYDYQLEAGTHIQCGEELPSERELLLLNQSFIEGQQRKVQDQLEKLEA